MAYIELENVCIDFPIPKSTSNKALRRLVQHPIGGKFKSGISASSIRALDKITLQLTKGDRVGLVGHNGAGKTTLLRVLAGVYPPSSGKIICKGRIASLLDISLGFDLEASGYENIFLQQLQTQADAGDTLVCISASGNSQNLIKAIDWSKKHNIFTVSLTAFDGGYLKQNTDLNIHVPTKIGEYGPAEDLHMVICGLVGSYFRAIFKDSND